MLRFPSGGSDVLSAQVANSANEIELSKLLHMFR